MSERPVARTLLRRRLYIVAQTKYVAFWMYNAKVVRFTKKCGSMALSGVRNVHIASCRKSCRFFQSEYYVQCVIRLRHHFVTCFDWNDDWR